MRRRALHLLLALAAVACSSSDRETSDSAAGAAADVDFTGTSVPEAAPAPAPAPPRMAQRGVTGAAARGAPTFPAPASSSSMLIRTGTASVEVEELATAIASVRQLAASLGGHVANTAVQSGRDQVPTATLELKIPAARFDQAVNALEPLGRVEAVNVEAQDVGEEFVDVTARLVNARRLEERLVALLAARAGRLEDVLAVERELARVREEIERYEGRLRYLESRVSMSTLVVTIHEPHPVLGRAQSPIGDAFRQAWRNFVGLIAWTIAALGIVIPVTVLAAIGYGVVRRAGAR